MSDLPTDALSAIDWLLDPTAADRRKEAYWRIALLQARAEIDRLRGMARELAGAQDTMALLVARGPEWSGYQQAMDAACLRRAQAIIALCETVRP